MLFLFLAGSAWAEADETVSVEGKRIREEKSSLSRTGQSTYIQPTEASRMDADQQLKRESSLSFQETGRISPSGFVIPKIRGQDSKLTDIYVEDIRLADPYSGLPLAEDLDLRAFGALELHEGVSPIEVQSANSVGVLRYRFRPMNRSHARLGYVTGQPYGHSLWGVGNVKRDSEEFRLYGRIHQTSGRYRYYSDEATPYNANDDRERTRGNNDQRSEQVLPYYRREFGPYTLQALLWMHRASRGILSGSPILASHARDHGRGRLGDISLSRDWESPGFLDHASLNLHIGRQDDTRETIDPEHLVINSASRTKTDISSNKQGIKAQGEWGDIRGQWTVEESQSRIRQSYDGQTGTKLRRSQEQMVFGLGYYPTSFLAFEGKLAGHRQWDDFELRQGVVLADEKEDGKRSRFARSETLSAALGQTYGIYGQWARQRRLPSLYEEFGNGGTVRPNNALEPEQLRHGEGGVFLRQDSVQLTLAYYEDKTVDKIVVVPILASASKALNIARSEIRGLDAGASVGWRQSLFSLKGSKVDARDLSQPGKKRLPGFPERIFISEWREGWGPNFVTHLSSRYRSEVYRDVANSVKLPGLTLYDLNLDYTLRRVELGLSIRNILNQTDVPIESGSSSGRTGISDIAGSPLPGRQWVLSLITNWE